MGGGVGMATTKKKKHATAISRIVQNKNVHYKNVIWGVVVTLRTILTWVYKF